ncbi:MAG TPA: GNAT family N-acetyltransferase [Candidatus Limnocylindrales bacterium]|nr:GNAT family N-acetyltransferase [Candidatus Limnocylindrales bacterium]
MTDEHAAADVAHLPGRTEAGGIADWAAARRADGEFEARPMPRSVAEGASVELREVTGETVREICALQVSPDQRHFVAPNAVSLAEASFAPHAWPRAIYADGVPVGFAMLSIEEAEREYFLWRLMIADGFQGRGYGRAAIALLADHVRGLPGATQLVTSWVPGPGSPEAFYLGLGFEPTGEVDDGEVVGRLRLVD